ncbi:hypothetical protein SERLADRAFT_386277, partial [Serpula lacrymans var. lacrymans S7.9]
DDVDDVVWADGCGEPRTWTVGGTSVTSCGVDNDGWLANEVTLEDISTGML